MFAILNGWDSNVVNCPSVFKNKQPILITIWVWRDLIGDLNTDRMQIMACDGYQYFRFYNNNQWHDWVDPVFGVQDRAYTIVSYAYDPLSIELPSGLYVTNENSINLPVVGYEKYGKLTIFRNNDGKWIFLEFIPTNLSATYINFYDGYNSNSWAGWRKSTTTNA